MIRTMGLVALFALSFGGALWAASGMLARGSERTVMYQYISDVLDALGERPNHVTWLPATTDLTRPTTPGDAQLIGTAMTQAWHALALAQSTGETAVLRDGFSGVAQERAMQSVLDARHGGQMAVLAQMARPQFYHLDGSVFQAEVSMLVARYLTEGNDLTFYELVTDQAVTTLMNETNGWRVFSHERFGAEPVKVAPTGWTGGPLTGINYYPAQTPWRAFWPAFDAALIAQDFDRIRGLGGTAVRVFLGTEAFSDSTTQAENLTKLAALLDLAEQADLQVVPTLFDLKPTFGPSGWGQDYAYLKAVLPVLAAAPAVAMIDIKNEPDLDFEAHGRGRILAWLTTMATLTRSEAPNVPLTIGWSSADAALELEPLVDVVTYHDYAPIETTAQRLAAVRAATDRPVMITEIGVSSYEIGLGIPGSPKSQQQDLAQRMEALAGADGIFVWTLHDFPNVDGTAVGASPWVQRLQGSFGLYFQDGREKPAAQTVRAAFAHLLAQAPDKRTAPTWR